MAAESNPSRQFTTEAQLVSLFEKVVGHKLNTKTTGTLSELECGDGIADIALYELRKDWEDSLLLAEIPPRWVYALKKLPYRKNFTTDEFVFRNIVSRNTALRILNLYAELGLCIKKGSGNTWSKISQPRLLVKNIFAVEAKLRHWQRALKQAIRYRDYASQSWVLMDEHNIRPAIENIDQFKRINIGLAAISTTGIITTYFMPTTMPPKNTSRFWQANSEIARRITSSF